MLTIILSFGTNQARYVISFERHYRSEIYICLLNCWFFSNLALLTASWIICNSNIWFLPCVFYAHATGYSSEFQHAVPHIKQTGVPCQIPAEICWQKRLFSYPAEVTSLKAIREEPAAKSETLVSAEKQKQNDFSSVDKNGNEIASGQTATNNYECHDCRKSYSSVTSLLRHQQYHCHPNHKRPFHCKYCDKLYVSLGALKMHIRTHTLPCKCKICGKAFSRPWLLQGHIRTHTGEKPYKCPNCQRAFADRSNLRAHLQTHSEVKKYSCGLCSKSFSRMSLLLKHEASGCPGNAPWSFHTE